MKTLNLIISCLRISVNLFSQNFPGKDVELLVGKDIQVEEMHESL